jgi:hypothetical protein
MREFPRSSFLRLSFSHFLHMRVKRGAGNLFHPRRHPIETFSFYLQKPDFFKQGRKIKLVNPSVSRYNLFYFLFYCTFSTSLASLSDENEETFFRRCSSDMLCKHISHSIGHDVQIHFQLLFFIFIFAQCFL